MTGKRIGAVLVTAICALALAGPAGAIEITEFSGQVADEAGNAYTQAGGHPFEVASTFEVPSHPDPWAPQFGPNVPDENYKDVVVDLPPGFVGNPTALPTRCTEAEISAEFPACPIASQVGVVTLSLGWFGVVAPVPLYAMEARRGVPATFAFNITGTVVRADAEVAPERGYALTVRTRNITQLPIYRVHFVLWGVPGDPAHDADRGGPFGMAPEAFLTNPVDCTAGPQTTTIAIDSWDDPGVFKRASFDHDVNGVPIAVDGCERVPFEPKVSVRPTTTAPDSPTGLAAEITLPQAGLRDPDAIAPAHMRDVRVRLPEGMTINPASAGGLQACSDSQLGLGTKAELACPDGSRIGTVSAVSPLVEELLEGGVYLRPQASDDPGSGEMFRLAIVLANAERGIDLRLPGQVRVDPATGRIETIFANNPQLPVERISLRLKDGPRAPLATPAACGEKTVDVALSSWAGHSLTRTSGFAIDCPGSAGFAPSFAAGSVSPTAGAFSPFSARIGRDDRQQLLSGVEVELPEGLLAKLRGVPLCGSAQAANGGCPAGSRIGTATAGAGPGSNPYYLQGGAFLTEGYKGAPYGMAVHVHAKAGPFDLGWVRVRQALYVDPATAQIRVVSDPLPQVVKGVPVRLRDVRVDVDRPRFTVNPTGCSERSVDATLTSIDGAVHETASRFQAGDCAALGFKPKLAMRLFGRKQTKTGGHPALKAVLTQGGGQSNVGRAEVALPASVVLDPSNSNDPKLLCGYDEGLKADCPASSVVGSARANTPLLNKPLSGKVHLVQGVRFGKSGNRIRTTPTLLVKLRGEVSIDLRARTTVKRNRLVTIFGDVPDARVSKFSMRIRGGKRGILVVTRTRKAKIDVCDAKQIADVKTDGHNGKRADFSTRLKVPCGKPKAGS